jgi:hypothetical protein
MSQASSSAPSSVKISELPNPPAMIHALPKNDTPDKPWKNLRTTSL